MNHPLVDLACRLLTEVDGTWTYDDESAGIIEQSLLAYAKHPSRDEAVLGLFNLGVHLESDRGALAAAGMLFAAIGRAAPELALRATGFEALEDTGEAPKSQKVTGAEARTLPNGRPPPEGALPVSQLEEVRSGRLEMGRARAKGRSQVPKTYR